MLKVGEKYKVKLGLKKNQRFNGACFIEIMMPFVGKMVTISSEGEGAMTGYYHIEELNEITWWTEGMFCNAQSE